MALSPENVSMALFCDFENVALGVRDANYDKFDIKRVLERLLLKGSIVVKKAYCDWERYKGFKATMHEANFELIEIPHVRQSGKNSADIRLVVDALDLCYTKSHVNTFVIISGDSDFSPLVSKLRENAKYVIGVGVKQSTSDLLIANCDEFIFYDDLVRDSQREAARRESNAGQPVAKRSPEDERRHREDKEKRKQQAMDLAVETFDALVAERGDSGKIWASVLKEAIKRRKPDFNESYYGFRAFGNLIEEAQARGLLEFGRDEKSGAYVFRSSNNSPAPRAEAGSERAVRQAAPAATANAPTAAATAPATATATSPTAANAAATSISAPEAESEAPTGRTSGRRQGRGKRAGSGLGAGSPVAADTGLVNTEGSNARTPQRAESATPAPAPVATTTPSAASEPGPAAVSIPGGRRQGRNSQAATAKQSGQPAAPATPRRGGTAKSRPATSDTASPARETSTTATSAALQPPVETAPRKATSRGRRPRKTESAPGTE